MKKTTIILFLILPCSILAGVHWAETSGTYVVDENESYDFTLWRDGDTSERGVNITGAHVSKSVATIPTNIDGAAIRNFSSSCFKNNTSVMKVVIPETVTEIESLSFSGCLMLMGVNIPAGVTTIKESTFSGCSRLRSITLPSGLRTIETRAFFGCSSLSSIVIPDGVTSIGSHSFSTCSSLESLEIPDSVTSIGVAAIEFCGVLKRVKLPANLTSIEQSLLHDCCQLVSVNVPEGVTSIASYAFQGCSSLKELVLPASVSSVGSVAFSKVGCVIFQGKPPVGLGSSSLSTAVYPKEYGELWRAQLEIAKIGGYVNPNKPIVTVVSSKVRENNPMVLDVVYKVTSTKPTVKVRALAFEDGERSFAKVTRPETFIEGTAANLGDAIAANVEHKLSWQVSSDFKTDLAKMKFEVLAVEDGILPLEFITIPANGANKKLQLSWNLLTEAQVFDALLWLFADRMADLSLASGVLKTADLTIATGTSVELTVRQTPQYISGKGTVYTNISMPAPKYVISKMGFEVLSDDALTYANEMTRLGLSPDGIRQYAYKWIDE